MSRLPDRARGYLAEAAMQALVAWALLKPMLRVLMLSQEGVWAMALLVPLTLFMAAVHRLPRRLQILSWVLGLGGFILWLLTGPRPAALRGVTLGLVGGSGVNAVLLLYADVALPLAVLAALMYARLLVVGEPGFSAPLLLSTVLMLWFSGARQDIGDFIPAVAAAPLLFVYAVPPGEALAQPARLEKPKGLLRAMPVVLVIVLLSVFLTPGHRVTNPELERQAERLRQMLNDHFFFTDARQSFSISALGYQPRGEQGLGGEPQVSHAMVMEVDTPGKVYLRATVLDLYSGQMWYDSVSRERYGYGALRWQSMRDALLDADLPAPQLRLDTQEAAVSILNKLPSTLFVPQRLRTLQMGEGMVPYLNASSELFITRGLQEGDAYSFTYEDYVAGQPQTDRLAQMLSGAPDARGDTLPQVYRQVPAHLQPNGLVAGLTRTVAGEEQHPYLKAMRIQRHLRDNYAYTLQVEDPPQDMDFVAHFLFDARQGYCTYFASAMTIMARMAGLNARYVEGFVVSPPEGGGPAIVTGQQAHAWTEVYIPAMGWVTFDATSTTGDLPPPPEQPPEDQQDPEPAPEEPQEQPTPQPEEQEPDPTEEPQPSPLPPPPEEQEDTPQPDQQGPRGRWWWLWLMLLLLIAFMVWRLRRSDPHRLAANMDARSQVLVYWRGLLMAREAGGQPILPAETPRQYAQRAAPEDRGMLSLADTVSALIYGRHLASPERVTAARLQYQGAYNALNPLQRIKLLASRLGDDLAGLWARGGSRAGRALRGIRPVRRRRG